MSFKRVRIILLTGSILIVLVIAANLILTYGTRKTTYAPLPEASATSSPGPAASSAVSNNSGLNSISVTTGNVQAVIATLARPDSYTRNIRIENFYGDKSAVYNITVTVVGGDTAMKIDNAGDIEHVILAGGKLYIWYEGDRVYHVGPADALGGTQSVSDQFQKILTYEDVLKPDVTIREASLETTDGEQHIRVKYDSDILKYVTTAEISVATGLLVSAEQYDGGRLVYRMLASNITQPVTNNSAFILPDGKTAR